jgi:thiamine monophosphate kinase
MALTDGEDFELLFTVPAGEAEKLPAKWKKKFRLRLTAIGQIAKKKGLRIINSEGNEVRLPGLSELSEGGYDHFG